MRILICAVGRARKSPARAVFEEYVRLVRWPLDLIEVEERKRLPPEQRRAAEAALLLRAVPDDTVVIALDEAGKTLSSRALASRIGQWRDDGRSCVAFLIGGADGLDDAVRRRADLILSLGRLTWPHLLVRGMLAEQIYRSQQILAGHPYHRD
ncbi:MAG: 23S rRNA (pseudouridine(1915)-N(3))-methyltransferase RlmH [Alphaproteobacteria bacterium]|nr:23S rRNA (pseudouridine(1915)-N(3))-methyltransferase RlmH [Alphaproteobacteria bacterium]